MVVRRTLVEQAPTSVQYGLIAYGQSRAVGSSLAEALVEALAQAGANPPCSGAAW
jgi:hypothetical protein